MALVRQTFARVATVSTGIVYRGSLIRTSDVTDGCSVTYLLGEKFLFSDAYNIIADGDNVPALAGTDDTIERWAANVGPGGVTYIPPGQDYAGLGSFDTGTSATAFGSAHSDGFGMAFCDGSVHFMSYTIDRGDPPKAGEPKGRPDGRCEELLMYPEPSPETSLRC